MITDSNKSERIKSAHAKATQYAACGNNKQARGKIADKT
jgi:hypothetical protein